jgi:hypothetical protein
VGRSLLVVVVVPRHHARRAVRREGSGRGRRFLARAIAAHRAWVLVFLFLLLLLLILLLLLVQCAERLARSLVRRLPCGHYPLGSGQGGRGRVEARAHGSQAA